MTKATGEQRYATPEIVNRNMETGRIGLRTGKGFLNYDDLDVDIYKNQKLAAFFGMLKHLDVLPACEGSYNPAAKNDSGERLVSPSSE